MVWSWQDLIMAKSVGFFSHVTGGFKLVDKWCINPRTGALLFSEMGIEKVQSHVHCFPLKVAFAKDTKALNKTEFGDYFAFLKAYKQEKMGRIKFVYPQDMSSIWKTTGRGGTAKVKHFPCYCCSVTTETLVSPQNKDTCFRGERCRQPLSFHHPMIDDFTRNGWALTKEDLEQQFPYLASKGPTLKQSKVFLSTINELRDENNPNDIDFHPSTVEEARAFNDFVMNELRIRELVINGTLWEKRELLKSALEAERQYDLIMKLILSTDLESAFIEIVTAIPCILHGGNRLSEKVFMMMLIVVWREATTKAERDEIVETVETFVNTGAFGTEQSRSQWKLPVDKEGNIDAVSFSAWRVRKILLIPRYCTVVILSFLFFITARTKEFLSKMLLISIP
jgi:hypothetical protein